MAEYPVGSAVLTDILTSNPRYDMVTSFILVTEHLQAKVQARESKEGHSTLQKFQAHGKAQNRRLPQIFPDIHFLPGTRVVEHDPKPSKISTRQ